MKAKVILFKPSGKYYTEEEWTVPERAIIPADMEYSKDFRRIDGGPVLIESQEPWGYPHLFPADQPVAGDMVTRRTCTGWPNGTWHGPDCGVRSEHAPHAY